MMRSHNITGIMIVVSRWHTKHIGQKRFEIIRECTADVIHQLLPNFTKQALLSSQSLPSGIGFTSNSGGNVPHSSQSLPSGGGFRSNSRGNVPHWNGGNNVPQNRPYGNSPPHHAMYQSSMSKPGEQEIWPPLQYSEVVAEKERQTPYHVFNRNNMDQKFQHHMASGNNYNSGYH
jgi:hypothetical protein